MFFCTGERLPPQLLRSALKDTLNASSVAAPRECYELGNERKCTELERERMSDDIIKLNVTELNYVCFESLFYFKQFSIVRTSEGFSIRNILYWKTHFVFPNVEFFY